MTENIRNKKLCCGVIGNDFEIGIHSLQNIFLLVSWESVYKPSVQFCSVGKNFEKGLH